MHPWLGTDFGRAGALFPVEVGLNGVVEEESILVEIILRLLLRHSHRLREGLSWRIAVLDLILIHVLGARGVLANVLLLSELIDEDLGTVPSVRLCETVLSLGLLNRQRKLSE